MKVTKLTTRSQGYFQRGNLNQKMPTWVSQNLHLEIFQKFAQCFRNLRASRCYTSSCEVCEALYNNYTVASFLSCLRSEFWPSTPMQLWFQALFGISNARTLRLDDFFPSDHSDSALNVFLRRRAPASWTWDVIHERTLSHAELLGGKTPAGAWIGLLEQIC